MGNEAKEGQQEGDDEIKLNGVGEKDVEKSRQSKRKKSVGAGDNIKGLKGRKYVQMVRDGK